jgi:hypothetical protein
MSRKLELIVKVRNTFNCMRNTNNIKYLFLAFAFSTLCLLIGSTDTVLFIPDWVSQYSCSFHFPALIKEQGIGSNELAPDSLATRPWLCSI